MMVPLLGPRLCKIYKSFWNDIICSLDKALDLFIGFIFLESDFFLSEREQKRYGDYLQLRFRLEIDILISC